MSYSSANALWIITPRACARGKVIGLSVVVVVIVVVVVGTKIARSRLLGICVYSKHNESVDIGEKLVSIHFELLNVAHKRYKLCIFHSACLWVY